MQRRRPPSLLRASTFSTLSSSVWRALSKPVGGADRGSIKAETNLTCLAIATREAQDAAACSGSSCDCDNVVLGVGDPRTSGPLLSGGADGLPTASQLVSARLGIDAALSLRHLYLWIFLLSSGLLRLSGSLSISASVNSYRTAGPSPAISASWVVVVIKVSSLPLSESFRCRPERKSLPTLIRLAVVLVPLLVAALFWAFYRYQVSSAAKGVTAAQSSASPSKSQQTAPIDERLSNAERAIMFSIAPLTVAARGDDADRSRSGRELPPAHCVASR